MFSEIISFLDEKNVSYKVLEHAKIITSKQAATVRGLSASQGAKSLLFAYDNNFILVILPGSKKVDMKKLRSYLGVNRIRLATSLEVKEITGVEIGACYPFGGLRGLRMIVDKGLSQQDTISFSAGSHEHSIIMKWKAYEAIARPILVDITL